MRIWVSKVDGGKGGRSCGAGGKKKFDVVDGIWKGGTGGSIFLITGRQPGKNRFIQGGQERLKLNQGGH